MPPDYEGTDKVDVFLGGCRWPIHAALTRRALIMDAGEFDATLSSCMDYDLWLRLGTQTPLVRVPEVLAHYWHHGAGQITSHRARIALNHWRAQRKYLAAHPDQAARLGAHRVRELTAGELLHRGYSCYWRRDLRAARTIFRAVMRQGYGRPQDWAVHAARVVARVVARAGCCNGATGPCGTQATDEPASRLLAPATDPCC